LNPLREPKVPKSKKKKEVIIEPEEEFSDDYSMDDSMDQTLDQFGKLTNKKKEYLQEKINDKNGIFDYKRDPQEYKKARKRMQNRESAVRSR
jgi:hypothetical protein